MSQEEGFLNTLDCIDNSRASILHKMYVSNVGNRLREMQTPSDIDCQRWPWELMQNAKDSISGSDRDSVEVKLEITDDIVIYQHDGCPFNGKTYLALLYKYSEGKANNAESTGRFGTGFLTTHSLSKVVQMEGPIYDDDGTICGFEVTMYRDGQNNEELIEGMKRMESEKKFWRNKHPRWTKFKYILKTKRNKESSVLGADSFKINIILTMLFNQKFKRVGLSYKEINLIYEKKQEKQKEEKNNVEIISYSLLDTQSNETKTRSFFHSKIHEYSKELSEHFDKERYLTVECALEIDPEQKIIICNEKSPCLFCSLPLVGSESHILPLILNSNDFEPSTERQEILLDGAEIKKDEKKNKEMPTDVGINRYILKRSYELFENIVKFFSENKYNSLHLLARGLKYVPKVNKYFDKKWYEEIYMSDMRKILCKYPIIFNTDNDLSLIKDIYFPIYDLYDDKNYTETLYKLVKELYKDVPRYNESIKWSKYLWEEGLEQNRIDIYKLIDKYNSSKHDDEFNNCFIKFIWDYYKELTFNNKILINQEDDYVLYNEKEFAQCINVSEDMINCMEELGNKWRINHLSKKITSIELPIKNDVNFAVNVIKKSIDNDKEKSYILTRYVEKNNEKRENLYYFSKLLFKNKINEKYIVENFKDDIWKDSDEFIINQIISMAEKWEYFNSITIDIEDYNKLLNFLYENNNKLFNDKKLLPSINGEFNFLKNLNMEYNINEEIKIGAKKYIDLKYDDKILHYKIKINDLNISKYCMDDLLEEINKFLNDKDYSTNKMNLCKILINYIPDLESNDTNNEILKSHNDIRYIYSKLSDIILKEELIQTKVNYIWTSIDKYIMIYLQRQLHSKRRIDNSESNYIDLINKYQSYFNFNEYDLIPNSYGEFLNIKELEDYNSIPEEILDGVKRIFHTDLKKKSIFKGLSINGIKVISTKDFGEIIEKCFENKKRENWNYFDYKYTYEICEIIIKYIPMNGDKKDYQTRLYNLYKKFNQRVGDPIEIDSYENLYTQVNKGIIQYINEQINNSFYVSNTKDFTDDIFKLINENCDLLDPYKYSIIPNQLGEFKKLNNLYRDMGTFEELKNILYESNCSNEKEVLMDTRITKFSTDKIMTNEYLINKINKLIKEEKLDIKRTLSLIPKKDDQNKQKELKYIYENVFLSNKLKEIEIDLEPSFWETTNKYVLKKFMNFFGRKRRELKEINVNEETALKILEILYKYMPPELKENSNLNYVPNQYGNLLGYNDLSEEKELNQNFKDMLKNLFKYNISYYLKHKKLNYKINKSLSINEEIIQIINDGFKDKYSHLKEKARQLIRFYPKTEEDNYVLKFIDCYKSLAEEKFVEEEINTKNINMWDKCIKVLLNDLLEKINHDENLSNTSKRIGLDEDTTIEKLNIFYSILFKFDIKQIKELSFIPNEQGIYKNLKFLYINVGIDNEIKEVLTQLNPEKSFDKILIHHKIKLNDNFNHSQKKLEDIASIIDKEVQTIYSKIDLSIQTNKEEDFKIDENIQKTFRLLIQKWLNEHKDKLGLFEFIKSHLADISLKVLFDQSIKKKLDNLLMSDPKAFIEMMTLPSSPLFFSDFSVIDEFEDEEDDDSFDGTRDVSLNQGNLNLNFNNFGIGNVPNNNYNNNRRRRRRNRNRNRNRNNNNDNNNYSQNYNNYNYNYNYNNSNYDYNNNSNNINMTRIRNEERMKKYCMAQAYVYEKCLGSPIFNNVIWENKISENEEGELVILGNSHRYKVKKDDSEYDLIAKTNENKEYKIKVKLGENSNSCYLKFKYSSSQWSLFNNESLSVIFAFVSLKNEDIPEIIFAKNLDLNNL